ncbi:uncharacterized protein TNCV_1466561 [Trichonephila clavipes]|nr:uncharacterized protein TNCV_1466561 [Trichonephila clavipes]
MNPSYLSRTVRESGMSMVYWLDNSTLGFLEGKQASMRYLDIMVDEVHPSMLHFYPDGDAHFMDDNATKHRSRSVQNWFAERQLSSNTSSLTTTQPGTEPIENVEEIREIPI